MGMSIMKAKNNQAKNTDKRQRILDTSLELIMKQGIQATSMSKVSKESGVAVGTIYHHFESKEAIITELYRHFKLEMLQVMTTDLNVSDTLDSIFTEVVIRLFRYSKINPNALEFCETFASSPIIDSKVREEVTQAFQGFTENFIGKMGEEGVLNSTRKDMLMIYLNGAIFSMLRAQIAGQIDWSESEVRDYMRLVWKGISL